MQRYETIIVGAGFSGIAAAHELLSHGRDDFLVLEQSDAVGGVWRDNVYPNAACDVQAHLYSLSFAPNAEWSSNYAKQPEIWAYQNRVVDELGIRDRIRFCSTLSTAWWDAEVGEWELELADGATLRGRFVIAAVGALNRPLIPDLADIDAYCGEIVHTAEWDPAVSMVGKRVAVIGAGASAIQVVPAAVEVADAVFVSIRTAPHVMPKPEELYDESDKQRFRDDPGELARRRRELYEYWNASTHAQAVMDEKFLAEAEKSWQEHMEAAITDPALRLILTPDSRFGCRRPVVSNDFYPALGDARTTVSPHAVVGFTEEGVRTADGGEWKADLVVLATGFRATEMFEGIEIRGGDGRTLSAVWHAGDGPEAFRGTLARGFPNLFLMTGPNTQASGSIIGVIEAQASYVARMMDFVDAQGMQTVDVTAMAQEAFNDRLAQLMSRSVWEAGGCDSWYKIGATGRVAIKWPGSLAEFERELDDIHPEDYVLRQRPQGSQ